MVQSQRNEKPYWWIDGWWENAPQVIYPKTNKGQMIIECQVANEQQKMAYILKSKWIPRVFFV